MLKTVGNPSTRYGDQTIVDGNVVVNTAGKGVDFSANPHATGMTSELLDWYEEGACNIVGALTTPGTSATPTTFGTYTRIGNLVTVNCFLAFEKGTGTGTFTLIGLPFTSANSSVRTAAALSFDGIGATGKIPTADLPSNSSVIGIYLKDQSINYGAALTDADMSATAYIEVSISYQV